MPPWVAGLSERAVEGAFDRVLQPAQHATQRAGRRDVRDRGLRLRRGGVRHPHHPWNTQPPSLASKSMTSTRPEASSIARSPT